MHGAVVVNTRNRMLSQNLYMSLNTRHTDLNNNILLIGGSGAGKTYRIVKPNLMQMNGSYVITDPKGEIMRDSVGFFKAFDYQVKVLNLLNEKGMRKSTRYNPLRYIMNDTDVEKLVTTFMSATEKKNSSGGDQYWTDMAGVLLQAYMYYAYYEGVEVDGQLHHDFKGIMKLVNMTYVKENEKTGAREATTLDQMFKKLERKNPHHPAVINYNKVMIGAADTVRSIISVLNSRTACLQSKAILDLLSDDEIDIRSIGVRKTVVYCMISDVVKTYSWLVSMLYQQMYQQMYDQADFTYGGSLPIHVTFMLDEYANVNLPDEYISWHSTQRSRNMSSIIIIQNLVQIKNMYDKLWESIVGNSDTVIYLGGNEKSTHEFISEMLDSMTIDKQTRGQTLGRQGSSSTNDDVMGRKLMLPGEVRKMSRSKCLVIISGKDPVIDDKIRTNQLPLWKEFNRLSKQFKFDARIERHNKANIVSLEQGGTVEQVKILDKVELNLLKEESRRQQEEYEEEVQVARTIGEEEPEAPTLPVVTYTLQELAAFVAEMENEEGFPESTRDYSEIERQVIESAEETYLETPEDPEANPAPAVLEQYVEWKEEDKVHLEETEQKESVEMQTEQRLQMVIELTKKGFSLEQIHVLTPVLSELSVDRLGDLVQPEMEIEKMKMVVEILKK